MSIYSQLISPDGVFYEVPNYAFEGLLAKGWIANNATTASSATYGVFIAGDTFVNGVLYCFLPTNASSVSYQWNRNGVAILGATKQKYTVAAADKGKAITCTASFSFLSTQIASPIISNYQFDFRNASSFAFNLYTVL